MTPQDDIQSLADFDQRLGDRYSQFVQKLGDWPIQAVQRRFGEYGIFPELGWGLLRFAHARAVETDDPELLHASLCRFIRCAHAWWGHADDKGPHPSGYDFCTVVVPAVYSALLGDAYLCAAFPASRTMSTNGYPAYTHAANLMLCLQHPHWSHAERALARARSFVASKSASKVDRSFVNVFLGLIDKEARLVENAIVDFGTGYEKSDWGRYKPGTRPVILQALVSCARRYAAPLDRDLLSGLLTLQELDLWSRFHASRTGDSADAHHFASPLAFLNTMEFDHR